MSRIGRKLAIACLAAGVVACSASFAAAAGAAEIDIRGVWEAGACISGTLAECEAKPQFPQKIAFETENFKTGALTGYGETTSGEKLSTVTGTISGCTVMTHTIQPGYESEGTETLSADGTKLQGTFSDSFGRHNQPAWASRASGPGCGSTPTEGEEPKKGLRATAASVICNYELATSEDVCGASVGDGGAGTPSTPTGTVKFTATSGGFSNGAACGLSATPLSPSVASCTVVFFASEAHLPTVSAVYGGDASHAGSTGSTQFLGAGLEEGALGQSGPSGQYPNEVTLETQVPTGGATVEATVQAPESRPQPVPLSQPPVAGLDTVSADDLGDVEVLAMLADLDGSQNATVLKDLNAAVEKLDARAVEVSHGPSAAERAEAQRMIEATNTEIEALTRMEKQRSELAMAAIEGNTARGLDQADVKLEKADEKIVELLRGTGAGEQARAKQDIENANRSLDEITKAIKQREEITKKVLQAIKASVSHRHGKRIALRRVTLLGHLRAAGLAAGKHKLAVKLVRARVKAAAGHRKSLPALVRTVIVLPSKLLKGGLPRMIVQPVTLTRRR